jgi:hypothetical protein
VGQPLSAVTVDGFGCDLGGMGVLKPVGAMADQHDESIMNAFA